MDDKRFVSRLPEHLQLQILSLVTEGRAGESGRQPCQLASHTPGGGSTCPGSGLEAAVLRLAAHGFGWCDAALSDHALKGLRAVAEQQQMVPAGVGSSYARRIDPAVRGDSTAWLPLARREPTRMDGLDARSDGDDDLGSNAPKSLWSDSPAVGQLRELLGSAVDLLNGLDSTSSIARAEQDEAVSICGSPLFLPEKCMLAHYPEGAKYVRHADVSVAVPHRRVTAIMYLNPEWAQGDGGELVLHPPPHEASFASVDDRQAPLNEPSFVVEPIAGRLLLFRSEIEHEVLSTRKSRWAITTWFSIDGDGPAPPLRPVRSLLPSDPPPALCTARPSALSVTQMSSSHGSQNGNARRGEDGRSTGSQMPEVDDGAMAPTIFVSIAAYRDAECQHTIASAYCSATLPSRIWVGACVQRDPCELREAVALEQLPRSANGRVSLIDMHWKDARGPVWARFLVEKLLYPRSGPEGHGTDYFLQIDSHTRFASGWDHQLIEMLRACGSPKPVLSTYPLPYEGVGDAAICSTETRVTHLCTQPATMPAFGTSDKMLRFRARLLSRQPVAPLPSSFWAAGFSFAPSAFVAEVPYDPHLPFLFFGEEASMVLRMFTRGWDIFAPTRNLLYHRWERHYRPTFWEIEGAGELRRQSQLRVRHLLTGDPPTGTREEDVSAPAASCGKAPMLEEAEHVEDLAAIAREAAKKASAALGSDERLEELVTAAMEAGKAAALAAAAVAPLLSAPIWGVGKVRTLRQYEHVSGIDFHATTVTERAERGGLPSEDWFWDRFSSLDAMVEERGGDKCMMAMAESS